MLQSSDGYVLGSDIKALFRAILESKTFIPVNYNYQLPCSYKSYDKLPELLRNKIKKRFIRENNKKIEIFLTKQLEIILFYVYSCMGKIILYHSFDRAIIKDNILSLSGKNHSISIKSNNFILVNPNSSWYADFDPTFMIKDGYYKVIDIFKILKQQGFIKVPTFMSRNDRIVKYLYLDQYFTQYWNNKLYATSFMSENEVTDLQNSQLMIRYNIQDLFRKFNLNKSDLVFEAVERIVEPVLYDTYTTQYVTTRHETKKIWNQLNQLLELLPRGLLIKIRALLGTSLKRL